MTTRAFLARLLTCLLVLAATGVFPGAGVGVFAADPKPRLVVMTDIGGDPDDEQSIVRFLLYACDFEIEGLCTGFGSGHRTRTRPDLLHKAVDAYGQVQPNLLKHRAGYPSAERLKGLIKDGSNGDPHSVGPGRDSEASDWIIRVLDRDDPRPVWFAIWGGPRELAQAIWNVSTTRSAQEAAAFKRKIRVHSISDQDRTARWVKGNHPDVFWIFSNGQFRGIWKEGNQAIVSPEWLDDHVRTGHGPLGAIYPPKAADKAGVKEGDTPSFLYVRPNGLSDPEHPQWGNWGGRFSPSGRGREYVSASDHHAGVFAVLYPAQRWRAAYQNDFAARMDWCVAPARGANHEPTAVLNGDTTRRVLDLAGDPDGTVALSAAGSSDPDGNAVAFRWWVYADAGTYWAAAPIQGAETAEAVVTIPADAAGRTIHVILEVTDGGQPPLTAYRRAILAVSGTPVPPPAGQGTEGAAGPSAAGFVPAPAGPWVFQRAVNVNGQAVEIDGRQWERDDAPGFACNGKPLVAAAVTLQPSVDAVRKAMLTSFRYHRNLEASFSGLPVGTYAVFVHIMEDNRSERLSFQLGGRPAQRDVASGDAGHWQRLGPWVTEVRDGVLQVTSQGGATNLCGIELWRLTERTESTPDR